LIRNGRLRQEGAPGLQSEGNVAGRCIAPKTNQAIRIRIARRDGPGGLRTGRNRRSWPAGRGVCKADNGPTPV